MKFTRKANAHWNGSGKEGKGTLSTESLILNETQYSFNPKNSIGFYLSPVKIARIQE